MSVCRASKPGSMARAARAPRMHMTALTSRTTANTTSATTRPWRSAADDPAELDIDCDGVGDIESGWARLRGLTNSSAVESYPNPALLGAHSKNDIAAGGRRLWESVAKQTNGDFYKTGTDDTEYP